MRFLLAICAACACIATSDSHGAPIPNEPSDSVHSGPELANVRVWIKRIVKRPAEAAREFAEYFRVLPSHGWSTQFVTELKALDLLAYYVEYEAAREHGLPTPPHPAFHVHVEYYRSILHPTSAQTRFGPVSSAARVFANHLLRELELDLDVQKRFELYAKMLHGGRALWADQIIQQIFVRSVPRYASLAPLMKHVHDNDFERFARAVSEHQFDFMHAPTLISLLWTTRNRRRPDESPPGTGDARCDQMLANAAARQNNRRP